MEFQMKKSFIAIACLAALPLTAGISARSECKEQDLCAPSICPIKKPGMNKRKQRKQHQADCQQPQPVVCKEPCQPCMPIEECLPNRRITPPIIPNVSCGWNVEISADFIWWKTAIHGWEYGYTNIVDNGSVVPTGTNVGRGHVAQPNYRFEPGFKIGIGSGLGHDGWDIFANYTWLNCGQNLTSSITGSKEGDVFPIFQPLFPDRIFAGATSALADRASSSFSQMFNVVDLELGRGFFISRGLILRPFIGLKGAWVHDHIQFNYHFIASTTTSGTVAGSTKFVQGMNGIGIRSGLNTDWLIWRNLGIYGNLAFTTLWSDFHIKQRDSTTSLTAVTTNLNTAEILQEVNPVIEAGLGLSYVMWNCASSFRFQFQLGWEEQVWLNFNQILIRDSSMSLHGLTANFNFTF